MPSMVPIGDNPERPFKLSSTLSGRRRRHPPMATTEFDLGKIDELIATEEAVLEPKHK